MNNITKFLGIVLLAVLTLSLTSCGGDSNDGLDDIVNPVNPNPSDTNAQDSTETTPTVPSSDKDDDENAILGMEITYTGGLSKWDIDGSCWGVLVAEDGENSKVENSEFYPVYNNTGVWEHKANIFLFGRGNIKFATVSEASTMMACLTVDPKEKDEDITSDSLVVHIKKYKNGKDFYSKDYIIKKRVTMTLALSADEDADNLDSFIYGNAE